MVRPFNLLLYPYTLIPLYHNSVSRPRAAEALAEEQALAKADTLLMIERLDDSGDWTMYKIYWYDRSIFCYTLIPLYHNSVSHPRAAEASAEEQAMAKADTPLHDWTIGQSRN